MTASASSALPAARPGLQHALGTWGCPMRLRSGVHKSARNPAPGKGEPSHPPQLIWQLSPGCWLVLPVVQGSCFGPSHEELGEDSGDRAPFPTTLPRKPCRVLWPEQGDPLGCISWRCDSGAWVLTCPLLSQVWDQPREHYFIWTKHRHGAHG